MVSVVAMNHPSPRRRVHLNPLHLALLALILVSAAFLAATRLGAPSSNRCLVSNGKYKGSIYTKPSETQRNLCLVESPWMRLAQHSVRLDGGKVIDDWLWIDYHDRINVLVEAPPNAQRDDATDDASKSGEEPSFLILSQTKYALESTSLAVVGGIVEPHEAAENAAKREVREELSVQCREWIALGKFRTDVNRGMGWVHPYLARDCHYTTESNADDPHADEVGGRDAEKQHVRTMALSAVRKAAMEGRFVEVQWSNTVALALLRCASH